jgi:hypothetical protein
MDGYIAKPIHLGCSLPPSPRVATTARVPGAGADRYWKEMVALLKLLDKTPRGGRCHRSGKTSNFEAEGALGRDGSLSETERAYGELETEVKRLKSAMVNLSSLEARP